MELAAVAPQAMRSIYMNLNKLTKNEKFQVSLESTHHGPSDLITPSLFVEIGSSETEWVDPAAGHIVACAILMSEIKNNIPIAVGFGGNHYASRQTKLVEETAVSFGHIFPTYKLDQLNEILIRQAFERSHADFAYFDRKSMSVEQRHRLMRIIENIGYEVIRESDIREMDGVPWHIYMQLRNKVNEFCPSGGIRITQSIKTELRASFHENELIELKVAAISPELLNEAEKLNRVHLESFIKKHCIAYVEQNNGRLSNCFIGMDNKYTSFMIEELTNECINILKEHYHIRYGKDEGVLFLTINKFNPELAKELGITSGPMFGALARGESVTIKDKTIKPDMVYTTTEKVIRVKNIETVK